MERYQIPAAGLILVGMFIAVNRSGVYIVHLLNPPMTELGFLAEMVTGGFLAISGAIVYLGIIGHRRKLVAFPSAVLVGITITLATFELRLYSHIPQTQSDPLIWLLITVPPSVLVWAILRSFDRREGKDFEDTPTDSA